MTSNFIHPIHLLGLSATGNTQNNYTEITSRRQTEIDELEDKSKRNCNESNNFSDLKVDKAISLHPLALKHSRNPQHHVELEDQDELCAATTSRVNTPRGKGVKRILIPATESDDSDPSIPDIDFSNTDSGSDGTPKEVCDICHLTQPPSERHRSISRWSRVKWIRCTTCDRPFHLCCTELARGADVSSFICYHCT